MNNLWLNLSLIFIALITSLLGVYKDAFLSGKVPRWFFFAMACLPIMAAALQIYQDLLSRKLQSDADELTYNVTPQSDPLILSDDQKEVLMNMINKVGKAKPGESKLFVAPDISSNTYYKLGLLFFNQRDFVQSEKYLIAALKEDKNNIAAINLLLQLYQSAAMNHLVDRETQAAEAALKKAEKLIENLPDGVNLQTLSLLGYVYKSLGQLHEKTDPDASEANWDKAGKIFETVLISNKKDPSALNGLGNVLHHKEKFKDAYENFKAALEVAPNYTAAANDAAMVCENLMKLEPIQKQEWKAKAIEYWHMAIQLSKNDPQFPANYEAQILNRIQWLSEQ